MVYGLQLGHWVLLFWYIPLALGILVCEWLEWRKLRHWTRSMGRVECEGRIVSKGIELAQVSYELGGGIER